MRTVELSEIFDVEYGNSLGLNSLTHCEIDNSKRVNFISRTRENNGISAYVEEIEDLKPFEAGLITVAGSGNSVLESFIQSNKFYTGYHVFILQSKQNLSLEQKLFYCYCIRQNQFKYSYGRQANKTLKSMLIPIVADIPSWTAKAKSVKKPNSSHFHNKNITLEDRSWEWFSVVKHFNMFTGKYYAKNSYSEGNTPLISSSDSNNGVMSFTDIKPPFKNCITIGKVGMSTFYQPIEFAATSDVTILEPKFIMNSYIAMFLVSILKLDQFKWSYGRQIRLNDSMKLQYKLPVTNEGKPDWDFMEYFIKSLPYSSNLKENKEPKKKNKGLSDSELVVKYESGEIDFGEAIKKTLKPND